MKKLYFLLISLLIINFTNAQLSWEWAVSSVSPSYGNGRSTATDSSGNIYITGDFSGTTITFGSYTLTNSTNPSFDDIFLAKYDAGGNVLWAKGAGSNHFDIPKKVITDENGDVYIIGYFMGDSITFDTYTLYNSNYYDCDIYFVKYDSNGNVIWAQNFGGVEDEYCHDIVVDKTGNLYITGAFESPTITFGSFTLVNTGVWDFFLVKFDNNGNALWAKSAEGNSYELGYSVALDTVGNAYVSGYFKGPTVTFGSYTLTNTVSNYVDIFLVKYDINGNVLWAKGYGGIDNDFGNHITTYYTGGGGCYMSGYFNSPTISFDSITFTNAVAPYADLFLVKFDANGDVLWAKHAGDEKVDIIYGLTIHNLDSSDVIVTGSFSSPLITFGSYVLTNHDTVNSDLFIVKYDANGNVLWAKSEGGEGNDYCRGVTTDTSGNIFVTGHFSSSFITFGLDTLTNITGFGSEAFLAKMSSSPVSNEITIKNVEINIYPNPTTGVISITDDRLQITDIEVFDIFGRNLQGFENLEGLTEIDLSTQPKGIYIIKVRTSKGVAVEKVILE